MSDSLSSRNEGLPSPEQDTALRFSLVNGIIERDWIVNQATGKYRFVLYQTPSEAQVYLRDLMCGRKLILGSPIEGSGKEAEVFSIPMSARPIRYDSSQENEGEYTYGDQQLFKDLGRLLGITTAVIGEEAVVSKPVDRMVALIEFTTPGEPNLFFVPGIEHAIDKITGMSPRDYYLHQLGNRYEDRFPDIASHFTEGFNEGLISGQNYGDPVN